MAYFARCGNLTTGERYASHSDLAGTLVLLHRACPARACGWRRSDHVEPDQPGACAWRHMRRALVQARSEVAPPRSPEPGRRTLGTTHASHRHVLAFDRRFDVCPTDLGGVRSNRSGRKSLRQPLCGRCRAPPAAQPRPLPQHHEPQIPVCRDRHGEGRSIRRLLGAEIRLPMLKLFLGGWLPSPLELKRIGKTRHRE